MDKGKGGEYLAQRGNLTARVERDECTENPNDWGGGDVFLVSKARAFYVPPPDGGNVPKTLEALSERYEKTHYVFLAEAYIHGGVVLAFEGAGDFPDRRWDVSTCGAVMVSRKCGRTWLTAQHIASEFLTAWNQYLSGDVWGYVIERHETDDPVSPVVDVVDACGGIYGRADAETFAMDALERAAMGREKKLGFER